ncbi:MAG: dTDP-4-dehydrorhamnose 3,5-epimerase family protein [Taibaiella sp.]|nr:dTDP-4-dehydrorhamnose 3,5-epimerase family protein [Taibaiella sp.]
METVDVLNGAKLISLPASSDLRGNFIKTFHESSFAKAGIEFTLRESYYSFSHKDVIRGMHFQLPPHDHSKIVFCPVGRIMDVIVDLRRSSPTYGQHYASELSADNHKAYFIPEGFAHGFKALTENAMTYYLVSTEYNGAHDTGISYDSIGYDWQVSAPILSARDLSFGSLADFRSPFE